MSTNSDDKISPESKIENSRDYRFGWFNLRATTLRCFSSARFLLALLCGYITSNLAVTGGLFAASVSTIEQRFSFSRYILLVNKNFYEY